MRPWNQEKQTLERDDFIVKIMKDVLKAKLRNLHGLFCIQNGVNFKLGFKDSKMRLDFWQQLETDKGNLLLKGIEFVGGGRRGEKLIIVQMYTAKIRGADVHFWLRRY